MSSAVLVLSGPSGAGKSTIINAAADSIGDFYFSVSTTTRTPREGEVEGKDYHFVTKEQFEEGIVNGDFLEYATVHGNYYGTSLLPVKEALEKGKLVIFDIDIQGHRLVRDALGSKVVSAFITPPTLTELEVRLKARESDSDEVISKRVSNAKIEIEALNEYDFLIVNNSIEEAKNAFISIANAARHRMSQEENKEFIKQWVSQ
ncbi:MAG TPA: guanylate kinase [Nitratifractor sp.]|jgi:guanylate kinase|nr:guanylate kinase [Nitratifractor sp.]